MLKNRRIIYYLFFALSILFFLSKCTVYQPIYGIELHHKNGLIVNVPKSLLLKSQTEEGFIFKPLISYSRTSSDLTISLIKNQLKSVEFDGFKFGYRGIIYYFINERSGGSGGTEYLFTAWKNYPNAYIYVKQFQQEELGINDSSFQSAWSLINSAKINYVK